MSLVLRDYQVRAKDEARSRIAAGCKRLLICSPTGSGKTVLFASIVESAVAKGSRVLVLAPKRELVKQPWTKMVRSGFDPSKLGIIMAGVASGPAKSVPLDSVDDDALWASLARRRPDALVQIASVDSIRNRAKPPADLVISDECHKILAKTHLKLAEEYPEAVWLGTTATPLRQDGRPLGDFFSDMIVVATYSELVASGHLVEPRCFTVPASELPDISRVRLKGNDFDPTELTNACDTPGLVGDCVSHWIRHGNNAPTFAFACSIEHSKHIRNRFIEAGIPALHVDGTMPTSERDAALRALRSGEAKVLTNVDVLCEGVDLIAVKTVLLCRPTRSLRIFLQQVGRGSRPDGSGIPFTVLDHAGSCLTFGLPQQVEFSPDILHSPKSKSAVSAAPARSCPCCWACLPASARECPSCGYVFQAEPKAMVEEQEGELVEVVAPTIDDLKASWSTLVSECLSKGYAPAWCFARWSEQYPGSRPPEGCVPPSAEECSRVKNERAEILDQYLATAMERGYKVMGWTKGSFKARCGCYPSFDLFQKTKTAGLVAEVCGALVAWSKRCEAERRRVVVVSEVVQNVDPPKPLTVANDVELVEYDLGA